MERVAKKGERESPGSSLDALISSFNTRVAELQELVVARNLYPARAITELTAVDATVKMMETQIQSIKDRLREERSAIPKAKMLVERAQRQQRKLQHMLSHIPAGVYENAGSDLIDNATQVVQESSEFVIPGVHSLSTEEAVAPMKDRKGSSAPRWYITSEELDSLSSYMRGRLTLDKINIAINEIACHADAVSQLITLPKKKMPEESWERALQLRDIATSESVKGKHFFLESDIKGPGLKLDNTGKAILTVLRHLCRINECRIGKNRVFVLLKPVTL